MAKATRKNYRGGDGASWVSKTVGDVGAQVSKALSPGSKTNTLSGGRRRRRTLRKKGGAKKTKRSTSGTARRRTRRRTGGFLGGVISSAIVPFGLWGAQRRMARRVKKGKK
tara:strand:+ start:4364 stop:4696 length:333 start_codon:yes stop_codon:yes gene_type:complete